MSELLDSKSAPGMQVPCGVSQRNRMSAGAHAAPVKALRSIARSSIGMHSAAAMTDSAIAASHTGRYEPARSNAAPPAHAPMNAPSCGPRNAIDDSAEKYFTPRICPTYELLN